MPGKEREGLKTRRIVDNAIEELCLAAISIGASGGLKNPGDPVQTLYIYTTIRGVYGLRDFAKSFGENSLFFKEK